MDRKENILIVHNYYKIPGGEDTVAANEKDLLENHGHKVILYTRSNSELDRMGPARKLMLPFTTIYNPQTVSDIKRLIRENHIDIVHVHNTLNLISPSVYYAAKSCGVPVVQTIHNFRMICPKATLYRNGSICEECIYKGLTCAVKRRCYRDSLAQTLVCVLMTKIHRKKGIYGKINYICLTDFNKDKLLMINGLKGDYGKAYKGKTINNGTEGVYEKSCKKSKCIIPPENVYVKPNFMPSSVMRIIPGDERDNYYIYAGRLDESKGVDLLLAAWKVYMDDFTDKDDAPWLMICGSGPMEDRMRRYIDDNRIMNTEMMGATGHARVLELMSRAKAMILPTRWYEGFPMSIAESYSVGTPVIGPDMGNVGNIIVNGKSGVTYPAGSLYNAIKNGIPMELYRGAYDEYVNKYTPEENYEQLLEIYKRVAAKNGKRNINNLD